MAEKTWTLEEQKEHRKLWAEALRSGKYEQGKGKLKDVNGAMCCLGVLSELAGCSFAFDDMNGGYRADGIWGYAPSKARNFVGLSTEAGDFDHDRHRLTSANDKGATFASLADLIESEPPGLFTTPAQPARASR